VSEWVSGRRLGSVHPVRLSCLEGAGEQDARALAGVNRPWAEWIAVQLERAGYTTLLQAWDFRPGSDFVHEMQQATSTAGRTIAVLSPAYFGSEFSEAEWRAAFVNEARSRLASDEELAVFGADPALQPLEGRVVIEIIHGTFGLGDEPLEVVVSVRPATDNVLVFGTGEGAAGADEDDELARQAGSNPASPSGHRA
jgi:TIR domain